jgi:hypothetical protein
MMSKNRGIARVRPWLLNRRTQFFPGDVIFNCNVIAVFDLRDIIDRHIVMLAPKIRR